MVSLFFEMPPRHKPTLGLLENILRERRNNAAPFCSGIIQNNETDIKNALEYMDHHVKEHLPTTAPFRVRSGSGSACERFRESSGYFTSPLSEKEARFPLAYSVVVYKEIVQFERLLRAIYMPQNYYCVHVDKNSSPEFHEAMRKIVRCFPNVFIASKLESVGWGEFSVLQAELNCMNDILRYSNWRYFINLTGQEFPLVTNRELVESFTALNNTNMIDSDVNT
jgi:hypothetical protein